jgi:type VI secretion system protein ImpA
METAALQEKASQWNLPFLCIRAVSDRAGDTLPLDFNRYRESRAVGTEQETAESETKAAARREAIAEGKITAEEFDEAFIATPKAWYAQLVAACDAALENIRGLSDVCDAKFGDAAPSFSRLQGTVGEFRQSAYILLQKKRETEPDPVEAPAAESPEAAAGDGATAQPGARRSVGEEPANRDDAVAWVVTAARYLRRHQPEDPAPYLMLRGLRWGELRAGGRALDPTLLDSPPTEVRQQLKRFSLQSQWAELLESAETAMGKPYGRGWLDIQRYVCRAAAELGRATIAEAVKAQLRTLLADQPGLPQMTLMDDTSAASADTLTWLRDLGPAPEGGLPANEEESPAERAVPGAPDVFEMANRAVNDGRQQEGLEMLTRALGRERSGRGRFHRKVQMAQLCLTIGKDAIAFPLLNDLAAEIEQRKLEEWESPDAVAHPLALLFRCLEKMETGMEEKQRLYERICRLDPAQAMSCTL